MKVENVPDTNIKLCLNCNEWTFHPGLHFAENEECNGVKESVREGTWFERARPFWSWWFEVSTW